jgi:hypothetical protein
LPHLLTALLLPLLLLLLLLLLLGLLLQVVQKVEYPIWVVYVTQALMFGGGLAGISYGILSTSWDPRREGSALGWTELQVSGLLRLLLGMSYCNQCQLGRAFLWGSGQLCALVLLHTIEKGEERSIRHLVF